MPEPRMPHLAGLTREQVMDLLYGEVTEPGLWHEGPLPGEDLEETVARRAAAADIFEELAHDGATWRPAPGVLAAGRAA